MPNGVFRPGVRPYIAFRFPDGSIVFDKRNIVRETVISRIGELVDYPFTFFQVARLSRAADLIQYALGFTEIDEAVRNGWIKLKSSEPQFGWTYSNEQTLRTMASNGHSASAIARKLGTSRNAVLSKIKRLRLKSRYDDRQQWLFDDFQTRTDPSKWRISSPRVYSASGVAIQRSGVYAVPPTPSDASSFNKNQRSFLGPDDGNSED
ncbi:GcrA family cell cycle regulator [Agrobacterium tumefaciens]|uniref:GcrA family cell cycle regulator n=1 Tax=Agrobacterium tumefaciens TaxID=358 RepID=UPI003457D192